MKKLTLSSPDRGGAQKAIEHATDMLGGIGGRVVVNYSLPGYYQNVKMNEYGFQITNEELKRRLNDVIGYFESETIVNEVG